MYGLRHRSFGLNIFSDVFAHDFVSSTVPYTSKTVRYYDKDMVLKVFYTFELSLKEGSIFWKIFWAALLTALT